MLLGRIEEIKSTGKSKTTFSRFLQKKCLNYDVLHHNKGNWMIVMGVLESVGYINIETFKKASGKSKKSPNQMSGKKQEIFLLDIKQPFFLIFQHI